jgi:hypothetical protein
MRIITSATYVWSDKQSRPLLVSESSIIWTGPVCLAKGASAAQNELAGQQSQFYQTMTQDYNQQFANQNSILNSLTKSLSPAISAGVNQFGYSGAEVSNLNAQAIQGTGQEYAKAAKSLRQNQAARGGGMQFLPSGANEQINAELGSAAANQASSELSGIQQKGYAAGRENYNNAVGQLGSAAAMYNPTGYSNSATGAGSAAESTMNQIQQENQAADPFNAILGAAGGVASSYLRGNCWVAAELYGGWKDHRTITLRRYIFGDLSKTFFGNIFAKLYHRFGQRVAKHIKTHPISRWFAQKIFDRLLLAATNKDKQVKHVSLAH